MNKETLRRMITACAGLLPMKNRVLLESSPDLADNTYPAFVAMANDPAFRDVELTWLAKDCHQYRAAWPQANVKFVEYDPNDTKQRLRAIWLALTSRCILSCNKTLWAPRKGQLSLFLGHGTPIKQCKGFYTPGLFCNRWSYPTENVRDVMVEQLGLRPEQGRPLGYPRNDALLHPAGALDKVVDRQGRTVLFWLPTFRQHQKSYDNNYTLPGCGLPLLTEEGNLEKLNAALERHNILLVLKPHPVQDMSALKASGSGNFKLLYDADLRAAGVQLYEVLADTDGMLTDYSSVYCDYLLTGKPIGLTFDDLEQYSKNRGLVMEDIRDFVKGRYLYTLDDLLVFLEELSKNQDPERENRKAALDYYDQWQDDGAARRVADYIRRFLERGELE